MPNQIMNDTHIMIQLEFVLRKKQLVKYNESTTKVFNFPHFFSISVTSILFQLQSDNDPSAGIYNNFDFSRKNIFIFSSYFCTLNIFVEKFDVIYCRHQTITKERKNEVNIGIYETNRSQPYTILLFLINLINNKDILKGIFYQHLSYIQPMIEGKCYF